MRYAILVLVSCATLSTPASSAAETPELKKLHVLMVIDTLDTELAPSVRIDRLRVRALLRQSIPPCRYELKELRGPEATRENILSYYKSVKAGRDDGLVFYYAGHGARDLERKQAFLKLSRGG